MADFLLTLTFTESVYHGKANFKDPILTINNRKTVNKHNVLWAIDKYKRMFKEGVI